MCGRPMQRWGRTSTGKIRWFCRFCVQTRTQRRADTADRWALRLFRKWLIGTESLVSIAADTNCTIQTLLNRFSDFWDNLPRPIIPQSLTDKHLSVDAVYLEGHNECVLIGRAGGDCVFWDFARQESLSAWLGFMQSLPKPRALVCDGQSGLFSAVKTLWPDLPIQRCLAHIQRLGVQRLTMRPKTPAGQELLRLVYALHGVETDSDKRQWLADFAAWGTRWERFLKERTYGLHPSGSRNWWYTHRRIRAMKKTLQQSLDSLFVHIDMPGVPRTTNEVEGGINSRLKELLHRHRGMSLVHRKAVVAHFLDSRNVPQKPTRNFN